MKLWMDLRLANDAGETVSRRRVSGEIRDGGFSEMWETLLRCVGEYSPGFSYEEDRSRIGDKGDQVRG